jgi:type II secretory pathway pseudopilin PulG
MRTRDFNAKDNRLPTTPKSARVRWTPRLGNQGVTALELIAAAALVTIAVGSAVPILMTSVDNARFSAAVQQIAGDMRLARSKAVSTAWEYRISGWDRRGGASANQYRVEGRRTSAFTWPATADPAGQTADRYVGPWVRIGAIYPGIQLDNSAAGANPPMYVGFDPSGRLCTPLTQCFAGVSPLMITKDSTGQTRQVSIAPATGAVRVQ